MAGKPHTYKVNIANSKGNTGVSFFSWLNAITVALWLLILASVSGYLNIPGWATLVILVAVVGLEVYKVAYRNARVTFMPGKIELVQYTGLHAPTILHVAHSQVTRIQISYSSTQRAFYVEIFTGGNVPAAAFYAGRYFLTSRYTIINQMLRDVYASPQLVSHLVVQKGLLPEKYTTPVDV